MSRKEKNQPRVDIYARITDRIVADLEKGVRPWMQPWHSTNALGRVTRPLRHNGLPYSGMNVLLLWSEAIARGFANPMWMTFKQALELGGAVRKGETGTMVVFASRFTKTEMDAAGEEFDREIPFLRGTPFSTSHRSTACPITIMGIRRSRSATLSRASSTPTVSSQIPPRSSDMVAIAPILRRSPTTSRCRRSRRSATQRRMSPR